MYGCKLWPRWIIDESDVLSDIRFLVFPSARDSPPPEAFSLIDIHGIVDG